MRSQNQPLEENVQILDSDENVSESEMSSGSEDDLQDSDWEWNESTDDNDYDDEEEWLQNNIET